MLFRYVLKEHSKMFVVILFIGIAIYLFSTFFERVDDFAEAGVGVFVVVRYLFLTIPEVISLILPAVFFLATVISLCMMAKNKELQALQAGGITPFRLLKYMLFISFFWGVAQLLLSQNLTPITVSMVDEIWDIEVRKRLPKEQLISEVWFADDNWIIYLDSLHREGTGTNITAYKMDNEGSRVEEIVRAKRVNVTHHSWILEDVVQTYPHIFEEESYEHYTLPFKRDHEVLFLTGDKSIAPEDLPLQYLYYALQELVESGSNIEALKTAIHAKIAYAASLIVLTFVAFALIAWRENVYLCLSMGIVIVFVFYVVVTMSSSLGETGALSPAVSAWAPHIFVSLVSLYYLIKTNYSSS